MTALLGTLALATGLVTSVAVAVAWARSVARGRRPGAATHLPLAAAAVACLALEVALLSRDFSVRYVAEQGSRDTPLYETVTSLWAGLEGSLLLWLLVLAGFTSAVARRRPAHDRELHAVAVAVMAGLSAAFFAIALAGGNAFARVAPVPTDGPGPNPLLQEAPLMGVHPPLLYLGYVGLAVPFAYAVAALVTGQLGPAWAREVRRWTLLAWTALTAGIVLGAWWSYAVLGWGGYWAWDPVENASLLPWLTSTALLHSLLLQQRRQGLHAWNLGLAAAGFLLVVVGTFLTRSGVVESVHAFTTSAIGPMLLVLLGGLVLGVLALLVWRADRLGPPPRASAAASRESFLLLNNAVLVAFAAVVLLGTLFPVAVEALRADRLSVGSPYFDRFAVPTTLVLLLLMALGPLAHWRDDELPALASRAAVPGLMGGLAAVAAAVVGLPPSAVLAVALAVLVLGTSVSRVARVATHGVTGLPGALRALGRRRRLVGGHVAHCGIALAAVAVAVSSALTVAAEQRLDVGETLAVDGWAVRLDAVQRDRDPRRMTASATLALTHDGEDRGVLTPRLSFWPDRSMVVGTPAVRSRVWGDVYATVTSVGDDGDAALVRLAVHPGVPWLWAAGAVTVAGGVLSGWPSRRSRRPVDAPSTDTGPVAAAGAL